MLGVQNSSLGNVTIPPCLALFGVSLTSVAACHLSLVYDCSVLYKLLHAGTESLNYN